MAQGRLHRLDQALRLDLRLLVGAPQGVVLAVAERVLEHVGDFVVGETVRGFDGDARLDARRLLARRNREQPVGIDLEGHPDARRARHHRRNAAQLEARQRTAVADELALALHHMHGQRRLSVAEGGELLRPRRRNRRVARNDLFHQPAHRLQAQRERDDVEQQPVVARGAVAGEEVGLHRRAERDDLVRIEVVERLAAEVFGHSTLNLRHARRSADHHHALHVLRPHARVAQRLLHRLQRLGHQRAGDFGKDLRRQLQIDDFAAREPRRNRRHAVRRQVFLGFARAGQQQARILGRERLELGRLEHPAEDALVEVVAAERRIAAGRQHFENAARQVEDRDVERAAAQVIDGIHAFGGVIQPVGDRRRRRLVEQAQHRKSGQLGGILGCLALGVVEVRGDGDHRADQRAAERILGPLAQSTQDLGRNFHRALGPGHGPHPHHAGRLFKVIGHRLAVRDVAQTASHEALDRNDGVARVARLHRLRLVADRRTAVGAVTDDRGQQRAAERVGNDRRLAAAHGRHQRIGGAKVDADGQLVLVRGFRLTGFRDLEKSHEGRESLLGCCVGSAGRHRLRRRARSARCRFRRSVSRETSSGTRARWRRHSPAGHREPRPTARSAAPGVP